MTRYLCFPHTNKLHDKSGFNLVTAFLRDLFLIVSIWALSDNHVFGGIDNITTALTIQNKQQKISVSPSEPTLIRIPHLTHTRQETAKLGLLTSLLSTLAAVTVCPSSSLTNCVAGTCLGIVGGCIKAHDSDLEHIDDSDKDAYIISKVGAGAISGCLCSTCMTLYAPTVEPIILFSGALGGLWGSKYFSDIGPIASEHILEYLYAEPNDKYEKSKIP